GILNVAISGINTPFPPKGLSISRIEREGVVSPRLEVKEGENVTGVRIFLNYGSGSLRGVISLENGTLPPGAQFVVRVAKPGDNYSYVRPPAVDARGHFMMEGLPTGTYEVTALVMGTNFKQPQPVKRTVTLTDGIITDIAITIDMGGQPQTN